MTSSFKFAISSMMVAVGLAAATSASALTLNTTGLKANATFQLSTQAYGSSTAAGVTFAPAGTTTAGAVDAAGNPSYIMPVTKATVAIGWDLSIKATYGESSGAALRLGTPATGGDAVLANFAIDYANKKVIADLIDVYEKTTVSKMPLYTFDVTVPEVISLKGFVLNQSSTIGNLKFTPQAEAGLAQALLIDDVLRASLAVIDWGTIKAVVTSYKRPNKISNAPFTLADVQ